MKIKKTQSNDLGGCSDRPVLHKMSKFYSLAVTGGKYSCLGPISCPGGMGVPNWSTLKTLGSRLSVWGGFVFS